MYALCEAIRPIRDQTLNPDDESGPSLVRSFTSKRSQENKITLRNNEWPLSWSVRFDDGTCVLLPHGGSENHCRRIAGLPTEQRISGWEWEPQKFGKLYVDRRRLLRQSEPVDEDLLGKEYVTVSNNGCEQRWVVVNEKGDAMRAGPTTMPRNAARI